MRWMNRVAIALITIVVVAGPPLLAGSWLLHQAWPPLTTQNVQNWLQQPRTPADVLAAVLVVAAVLWLLLAGYLLRRTLVALTTRWRRLKHLPLPTPAQMTAGSMAGVAAFTLPTIAADHATTPPVAATPPPADPSSTDASHAATTPTEAAPAGIALPGGGWLPYPTALAVTVLSGMLLLHRRRTYRPELNRLGSHHHDLDLQAHPPTVQAITATLDSDESPQTSRRSSHRTALSADQLPAGLLALCGPGALAAARGLLVTAALNAATNPSTTTVLTVRRDDWRRLLPEINLSEGLPGLRVVADLTETNHTSSGNQDQPSAGPAIDEGSSRGSSSITTVLVLDDTAVPAAKWHVAEDGTATGTGIAAEQRLCILDRHTATDLFTLVQPHRLAAVTPTVATVQPFTSPTARAHPTAKLTLLGGCGLTIDDQPVRLRRTAALQILVYLAIHPEGASRAELITAIWPNLPPSTITQRLHTTLSDLRRQLQPMIGDVVLRCKDRYRLNDDTIDTDLRTWRAATTAVGNAISTASRTGACQRLTQLYRGELAAGQPWPWMTTAREAMRRDALDACTYLADTSPSSQALTWLHTANKIDPYNADIQRRIAVSANTYEQRRSAP